MADNRNRPAFREGPAVALVESVPGSLARQEQDVNRRIRSILDEAFTAGFLTEIKAVSHGAGAFVILYELKNDPNFRDPFG